MKALLPNRKTVYSQEVLVHELLGLTYGAHDALGDVNALQKQVDGAVLSKVEPGTSLFFLLLYKVWTQEVLVHELLGIKYGAHDALADVTELLGITYGAHDALTDVNTLQKQVEAIPNKVEPGTSFFFILL